MFLEFKYILPYTLKRRGLKLLNTLLSVKQLNKTIIKYKML